MVVDTLFPRQRGVFPKNMPLSIFVKIIQFIATVSGLRRCSIAARSLGTFSEHFTSVSAELPIATLPTVAVTLLHYAPTHCHPVSYCFPVTLVPPNSSLSAGAP